jgi:hypothetical protein
MQSLFIYQPGARYPQTSVTTHPDGTQTADHNNGETVESYLARMNAKRKPRSPEFKLMTWEELNPIITAKENELCEPWQEITDQLWDDALNVLPPEKWETVDGVNIFRISERLTGNITAHYARTGFHSRYFMANRRTSTPYAQLAAEVKAKADATEALRVELAATA